MTEREMREEIMEAKIGRPNGQWRTGIEIQKVGKKYVTFLNLYDGKIHKLEIEDFYRF